MKRLIFIVLIALGTSALKVYSFEINGLHYATSDSTATVIRENNYYEGPGYSDAVIVSIPSKVEYNGRTYKVTEIGYSAFAGCSGLTSVTIPNSVTEIGLSAFKGCTGLTSVTIPDSVTEIGLSAFNGCSGLTSVTIPNSVTSIGSYAFSGCSNLKTLIIPSSVIEIGDNAFRKCGGLISIVVESNNPKYDSRDYCNAIIETETNTLLKGCNNSFIPNSVTSIAESAFFDCSGLKTITIPSTISKIEQSVFFGCGGLISVTIPNSVTSIGKYAFKFCNGLTSIVIPRSVKTIGEQAFYSCDNLNSVNIENPTIKIGEDAFEYCSELKNLTGIKLTYNSWYKSFVGTKTSSVFSKKLDTINANEKAAKERAQRAKEQAELNKFKQSVGIKAYNSLNQGLIYNGMKFSSIQKFCERYSNDYSLGSAGYGSNGASLWNLFVRWNDSYTRKYRFWVKNGLVSGFSYEMYYDPKN